MAETHDSKEIKIISHTLQFRTILYTSSPCTDSALRNKMMTDCVKRGKAPGRLVTALLKVLCQIPTQITNPRCMTDNSVANFFSNVRNIFVFWKSVKNLTDFKPLPSARWFNTALPGCFLNSKLGTSSSFFKDINTKNLRKRYHLLNKKNQANLFSNSGVVKQISQNHTKQAYTIPNRTELYGSFTHSTASKITRIRMLYYVWNKKHFDLQQIFFDL